MSGLTKDFLADIGVQMNDQHFELFAEHFDETLYARIEDSIVHTLRPDQVSELVSMRGTNDDDIWQWLQVNVPNLGGIIQHEIDAMLAEVVRSSDHL